MNESGNDTGTNIGTDTRLEFRDVTKRFQDRQGSGQTITAVEGVSLSVRDGEVVSLIGPSGCGKSTLLNLARSFKASRMQVFWKIQVPASMPPMFAGLRIGATLAVIGVAVGEFAGGNSGVGYLIVLTAGSAETPKVFAAIFVLTMIGIFAYCLVIFVESRVLHYMPSREHRGF